MTVEDMLHIGTAGAAPLLGQGRMVVENGAIPGLDLAALRAEVQALVSEMRRRP